MSKGTSDFGDPPLRCLSSRVSAVTVCSVAYSGSSLYSSLRFNLALDGQIVGVLVSPLLERCEGSVEGINVGRQAGVFAPQKVWAPLHFSVFSVTCSCGMVLAFSSIMYLEIGSRGISLFASVIPS